MASLFLACEAAELVCPSVLSTREMVQYITRFAQTDPTPLTRTTRELFRLLTCCADRPPNTPIYVHQDRLIIESDGVRLSALSPSDDRFSKFLESLARLMPVQKSDRRAAPYLQPNDVSVACILQREGFTAIFGADLEEGLFESWSTVVNRSVIFRLAGGAKAFKVAHHGSSNADCPALWESMDAPVAILTPFKNGSHKIPSKDDVARILGKTPSAFSAASFRTQSVRRLSRADKILRSHGMRRRRISPRNGHVRLRIALDNTVDVALFQQAVHLSKVH